MKAWDWPYLLTFLLCLLFISDYINAFYEISDHQNMGLDVISIHVFLSLNDILQEHFFRIMAD